MSTTLWPVEETLDDVWDDIVRAGALPVVAVDPLNRLLDPSFTETLWEYEHSRTEPLVPGEPHEKQDSVFRSGARHRWLFWGNQTGKTTAGAVEVALLAMGRHPHHQYWQPPLTIWASALTWELWEKILLPELLTWVPPERVIDAPTPYQKSTKRDILVRADNGKITRITGKASEQGADKYQSARVHAVWLDEEHPESVWDEMQPRLVRHGGITIATMTPLKGFSWVYHRIYEPWRKGEVGEGEHFCSHAGLEDNPAVTEEEIEALKRALRHNRAQLEARLHGAFVAPEGLALDFDPSKHFQHWTDDEIRTGVAAEKLKPFGGIDFGSWRFAFVLAASDRAGRAHVLHEHFSHREDLTTRAKALAKILERYGIDTTVRIWGDAANQQDIIELNAAWKRLGYAYRVMAVSAEGKARSASVERLNDLLGRQALLFRRGLGSGMTWRLGMDSAHDGHPVEGSRLLWEIQNWSYPEMAEGKAQKQDPDDDSADGADEIAALRYAVMSWWKGAAIPERPKKEPKDSDDGLDKLMEVLGKRQAEYQGDGKKNVTRRKNAVKRKARK